MADTQKTNLRHYYLLAASIGGGALLWLAWPPIPLTFLVFVGLMPLLWLQDYVKTHFPEKSNYYAFLYGMLFFLSWNGFTTWWVSEATLPGAIAAIIANSLLMSVPFMLFHLADKTFGKRLAYFALIAFWITYEYIHLSWQLAWPWLNLGNIFSITPNWVQWYEFTGALGGTLWVWLVNILFYELALVLLNPEKRRASVYMPATLLIAVIIAAPIFMAGWLKNRYLAQEYSVEVVVVQPNIDPYKKFDAETLNEQIEHFISLSEENITDSTVLVVWPETALPSSIDAENLASSHYILRIQEFLKRHNGLKLLTGLTSYKIYNEKGQKTLTARTSQDGSYWYDIFNSGLLMDGEGNFQLYHKSKLVPGVEKMPYPEVLGFLERYAIDLGGPSGSMGAQDEPTPLRVNDNLVVAPIICYESIFGGYVTGFVERDANLLAVITNDAWWSNTPGYKQHNLYATLRAIETRKAIARSANTGISGFFDTQGNRSEQTEFLVPDARRAQLPVNNIRTFYVRHGDYIGRVSAFLSVFFILALIIRRIIGRDLSIIR